MELKKRIYCIEGVRDCGDGQIEPTILPMLELLQRTGYWSGYLHRSCATAAELEYRLSKEWNNCCAEGSVLYFITRGRRRHGRERRERWSPDRIWLSDGEVVGLSTLQEWPNLAGCHVHFGGCRTFPKRPPRDLKDLRDLMEYTDASSVSGYAASSDWFAWAALELVFFRLLSEIDLADGRGRAEKLRDIEAQLDERFPDCEFRMLKR